MNSEALLSTSSLRRACVLVIVLSVAIFTTNAEALPEPKVTFIYSMVPIPTPVPTPAPPGPVIGAYHQDISGTILGAGDAHFKFVVGDSGDAGVDVQVAAPLEVWIEFTANAPGGNIVDGPVELTHTHFERKFVITSAFSIVTTELSTILSEKATGDLVGTTITWDNVSGGGMSLYQEEVTGRVDCVTLLFDACNLAEAEFPIIWNQNLQDVPLPLFTLGTNTTFGDVIFSDNGTPGLPDGPAPPPLDDIFRDDPDATVWDTWHAVSLPEPSGEILLLAGVLGLAGLHRLRERGGAPALFASRR